ncbi:MAG TPA: alanine racemase, partial [Burkholderiales bacterium]|nr:alanine racemase [Burkholderiales bacterium]
MQSRVGGKPVMAVIKANAYGHGLLGVARTLEAAGAKHFMVGKLDEALDLRNAGVRARILNFGPWSDADAADIIRLGISQNVYTDQVRALDVAARRVGRRARVHIKVDTGLGRFGIPHDRAFEFLEQVAALRSVAIEGVFTTFTEDSEFDAVQLSRLKEICARATHRGLSIGLRHAASSDAICEFPAACTELDMVRPGIMLYGLFPSTRAEKERKLDLKPALSLKARVAYVKTLRPGESVSYHRAFTASQPERIATLAAGYSDGFPRTLAA